MPTEWDKEAGVLREWDQIHEDFPTDPSAKQCGGSLQPWTYQNNYFMWAIFNHPELARRMIVEGVDPNVQPNLQFGERKAQVFGRQSPIFAVLRYCADPLLVEY